jgi:protein-S-isoprenylcysteine O-methyltransferase Ste14
VRPFVERDTAAGVIFWTTLAVWGAIEWVPTWREARERRRRRESWSGADQGTGALIFLMIYVGFALALLVTYRVPDAALPGDPWVWLVLGILLVAVGIALRLWAIRTLGRFFTRDVRVQEGQVVIEDGPYRWVRHPSYLGGLISAAGFGVALGNWLAIPAAVIPDLVGLVRRINVEESVLRDGLAPGQYDGFARHRARLIPGVW